MKRKISLLVMLLIFLSCIFLMTACGEKAKYDLSFIVNNETYYTFSTSGNQTISMPENPTKVGYEFDGWFLDNNIWNRPVTADFLSKKPLLYNLKIYSKWKAIEYTASFYIDEELVGTSKFTLDNVKIPNIPEIPEKIGHTGRWENYTISANNLTINAIYSVDVYDVVFDEKGGSFIEDITYTYGVGIYSLPNQNDISKTGYRFIGWKDENNNYVSLISTSEYGNKTLYADWEAIEYTASFYADNQLVGTAKFTLDDETISNIPTVPEKVGFDGEWDDFSIKAENLVINAIYTTKMLTVTWKDFDGSILDITIVEYNTTPVFSGNTPTKNYDAKYHYKFDCWMPAISSITENTTYTACYVIKENADFVIKYDSNGGINTPSSQYKTQGADIRLKNTVPTKEGHIFVGWDCVYDGKTYAPGETFTTDANVTLYAHWEIMCDNCEGKGYLTREWECTFCSNGWRNKCNTCGSYSIKRVVIGGLGSINQCNSCLSTSISSVMCTWCDGSGHESNDITCTKCSGVKYIESTPNNYTITLKNNTETENVSVVYGHYYKLTVPIKRGYEFIGWFDSENGGLQYTNGDGISLKKWSESTNKILYARWSLMYYTITYDCDSYVNLNNMPKKYTIEDEIITLNPQNRDYFVFEWRLNDVPINQIDTSIAENITIKGVWIPYEVGIEYDINKIAIRENDVISAELFSAYGIDNSGNRFDVDVVNYSNIQTAGATISIKLSTIGLYGYTANKVISVKVYAEPTIESYNTEKTYINYTDVLNKDLFNIVATDTFGNEPEIKLYILNENYKFGDLITLQISAMDIAGNETLVNIDNIKYYGAPNITYSSNGVMKVTDTICNEYFNVSASDSFGKEVEVTTKLYSGTFEAGEVVKVSILAKDECGNINEIILDVSVYGTPYYSWLLKDYKVDEEITNQTIVINAYDSFDRRIATDDISVVFLSGEQKAGSTAKYQITLRDIAGNEKVFEADFKIYGMPTISYDLNKQGIKDTDKINTSLFNAKAIDSFGNSLNVSASLYSGDIIKGEKIKIKYTTEDDAGNVKEVITEEIGVYSVDDLSISYSSTASSYISIKSHGEEFNPVTKDSFNNATNTFIDVVSGQLIGGEFISFRIGAVDNAGNIQYGPIVNNVAVYDCPTIEFKRNTLSMYSNEKLIDLFNCCDSLGASIYPQIEILQGEFVEGTKIVVKLTVVDIANNTSIKQFEINIIESNSAMVTIICGSEIIEKKVELNSDYILPLPSNTALIFKGWKDVNGVLYTDASGNSIKQINNNSVVELYADIELRDSEGYLAILSTNEFINYMTNSDYWNTNIRLYNNINLNRMEWTPIGSSSKYFTGIFDGNGFTVSNYRITTPRTYTGLFGYTSNAYIKNLGVTDFIIQFSSLDVIYSGGIVATLRANTFVSDCYADGIIDVLSTSSCYVGGIVGNNINASSSGSNDDCNVLIQNCYSNCDIKVSGQTVYVGGIVGYLERVDEHVYIRQSFSLTNITSSYSSYVGQIYGYLSGNNNTLKNAFGCTSQIIKYGTYIKNPSGKSLDELIVLFKTYTEDCIWDFSENLPKLKNNCSNDYILISCKQDLLDLPEFVTQKYKLSCDINLEGETYYPKNGMAMIFDGNGYTISNLAATNGLFSDIRSSIIKNVTIVDLKINMSSYNYYVGGICGYAIGSSISRSSVQGESTGRGHYSGLICGYASSTTIKNCYAEGNIKFSSYYGNTYLGVGGIVGQAQYGSVKNCYSVCTIEGQNNSDYEDLDSVSVGGVIGKASYTIIDSCYSDSKLIATREYTSKSIYIGGLLGYNYKNSLATVTNCYISDTQTYSSNSGSLSWSNQMSDYSRVICASMENIWSNVYSSWDSAVWNLSLNANPTLKFAREV